MKKIFENQRKMIICALIIAFIVGPLLINVLFKIHAPFSILEAEWGAGDALSLFAVIFASVFAIYGISITIKASNEELKESIRHQALPFIIVDFVNTKTERVDLFSMDITDKLSDEDNGEFEEYVLREFSYVFKESGIEVVRHLNGEQQAVIKYGGIIKESPEKGIVNTVIKDFVYLHLILENVGKGAAVQMRIGLNRNSVKEDERKYVNPIPLKIGEKLNIGIYAENINRDSSIIGEYLLELYYKDMYGNEYYQKHDVEIMYDEEKGKVKATISTEQNQVMLVDRSKNDAE